MAAQPNTTSQAASVAIQPTQRIREWKDQDYMDNLRFLATQYYRPLYDYGYYAFVGKGSALAWNENYVVNESYYFGMQSKSPFDFFIKDETNTAIDIPMFQGTDCRELVDKVVGNMLGPIKELPKMISAGAISPNALSRKMILKDLMRLKINNRFFFEIMQEMAGIDYKPMGDLDFADEEQLESYFTTFRDSMEMAYSNFAKDSCYRNHWVELFAKQALYYCIGGFAMMKHTVRNGKPWMKKVEPVNAIWDNFRGDDQHREDRIGGEIYKYTLPELFTTYNFSETEQKEIEAEALTPQAWGSYNWSFPGYQFRWRDYNDRGIPTITAVEGQWRSLEFREGEWVEVLREGVLIGNKWLRAHGISSNTPVDRDDKSKLKMKYVVVTPGLFSGINYGIIDVIKRYQNLKDAFKTKMIQLIARSKGKTYVVYEDELPEGMNTPALISQLSQCGIYVTSRKKLDGDKNDTGRAIEPVDMTLDPSVVNLALIIQQERQYMENIISLPATAQGVVQDYQSHAQIQNNMQQSKSGLEYFYSQFFIWVKRNLELQADMAKNLVGSGESDEEYYPLILGDVTAEMLKVEDVKDMAFEDFGLYMGIDDYLTAERKEFWRNYFVQKAANSQDPIDEVTMAKIEQFTTNLEMVNYMQMVAAEKIARQEQQMAKDAALTAYASNNQKEAQIESAAIGADAKLEGDAMNIHADLMKEQPQ